VRRISPLDFLFSLARSVPSEYASSRGISNASILDITRMPERGESETYLGGRNMRAVSSHSAKYILSKFRIYRRHSCRYFSRAKCYRVSLRYRFALFIARSVTRATRENFRRFSPITDSYASTLSSYHQDDGLVLE